MDNFVSMIILVFHNSNKVYTYHIESPRAEGFVGTPTVTMV